MDHMTMRGRKGRYNSSATRIRPFFETLVNIDPAGEIWLPKLLGLFNPTHAIPRQLLEQPGQIQKMVFETDTHLEHAVGPPRSFLEWLIKNPERMTWPDGKAGQFSPQTTRLRSDLLGRNTENAMERQFEARELALSELAEVGSRGSLKKWWAFEGTTKVDCYIQTDRLKVYIEGKRTEVLSAATAWYRQRNQLLRNIEAAKEDAAGTPFVCFVLRQKPVRVSPKEIALGLPHMDAREASELMQHYIGDVSWENACEATGINYCDLPDTCEE